MKEVHSPSEVTQATLPQPGTHSNTVTNNSEHATPEPASIHLVLDRALAKDPISGWSTVQSPSSKRPDMLISLPFCMIGYYNELFSLLAWVCRKDHRLLTSMPQNSLLKMMWLHRSSSRSSFGSHKQLVSKAMPSQLQIWVRLFQPSCTTRRHLPPSSLRGLKPPRGQKATHSLLVLPV